MTPLVSVVIPTFNRGNFVRWAIQSALSQTHSAVEVIIVDDGSTDETEEVIQTIKDPRVRYFRTDNQGNYCARNIGLEKAKGEFIAFLDSDDQFLPEKIAKQLEQFKKTRLLVYAAPTPISSIWEILTGYLRMLCIHFLKTSTRRAVLSKGPSKAILSLPRRS